MTLGGDLYPIPEVVTPSGFPNGAALIQGGEQWRFAMAVLLRGDFDAARLRRFAKTTKDGPQAPETILAAPIGVGTPRRNALHHAKRTRWRRSLYRGDIDAVHSRSR